MEGVVVSMEGVVSFEGVVVSLIVSLEGVVSLLVSFVSFVSLGGGEAAARRAAYNLESYISIVNYKRNNKKCNHQQAVSITLNINNSHHHHQ